MIKIINIHWVMEDQKSYKHIVITYLYILIIKIITTIPNNIILILK